MIWLARLIIRERLAKLIANYGWSGSGALAVFLAVFAVAAGSAFAQATRGMNALAVFDGIWLAWVMAGVFLGRDGGLQIRLDRLVIFPVRGFLRLYVLGHLLSFASFPLLLILITLAAVGLQTGSTGSAALLAVPAVCCLFASSVRLTVSVLRTAIHRSGALPGNLRFYLLLFILTMVAWIAAGLAWPGWGILPGHQFGLVMNGGNPFCALFFLAAIVLGLSSIDFFAARSVTYSGIAGPHARGSRMRSGGLLLACAGRPPLLWRISMLGWLRNRNAVLLFAWGGLYGFSFLFFSGADEPFEYFAFCWMVLIFHSYLRGNLLGIDHRAVWLYYMFPVPACRSVQVKNKTLSVLQGCMLGAVLLPCLVHPIPTMGVAAWFRLISYAWSSLVIGEISGSYFSLHYPEPIERSSHFSGGMTPGALAIPFVQLLFLGAFTSSTGLARRFLPPAAFWLLATLVPVSLCAVQWFLVSRFEERTMLGNRRAILCKLSVFSS